MQRGRAAGQQDPIPSKMYFIWKVLPFRMLRDKHSVFGENIIRWSGGADGGVISERLRGTQSSSSLYPSELRIASE